MRNQPSKSGFTLIELMIVVVVLGVLAAIALPKYRNASARAKEKEADLILRQVHRMQEAYRTKQGRYAETSDELQTVGWAPPAPDHLKYYQWDDDVLEAGDPWGDCLKPNGRAHKGKQLNITTGATRNC